MNSNSLVLRGLTYYWRTNAAVVLGVATAVAVLAGALVVGDSVRGSLRGLVSQRLGSTDFVIVSSGFFPADLADRARSHHDFSSHFADIVPIVMAQGFVTRQSGSERAGQVAIYGVDDRFWRFHNVTGVQGPADRDALVSPALAREVGALPGETVLVRLQRPTDIPIESLFGRKEDLGRTVRLTVRTVVSPQSLGEFALQPRQGEIRAVFVPLARLQQELEVNARVNALLVSAKSAPDESTSTALMRVVRDEARLGDVGLRIRQLPDRGALSVETDAGLLTEAQARAAQEAVDGTKLRARPVLTYLANALRSGDREIPYSLVTAIDRESADLRGSISGTPPIILNTWAAQSLSVSTGDPVTLEYYIWEESGRLLTRSTEFWVAGVVPIDRADSDLAPVYPGISDSPTLEDWDPPFPIDLRRVRKVDEEYWRTYRTTPKAFIPLAVGQKLWGSRYGSTTSVRLTIDQPAGSDRDEVFRGYERALRTRIDPLAMGLGVRNVRAEGLAASRGATDFGEYFVYFSFFLVVSALLLAALFFKLSIEQRAREVGLLRSVGFRPQTVRQLFLKEGFLLSVLGSVLGVIGAIAYASLIVTALRTRWVDAVGTTALTLHVSPVTLGAGAIGGVVAALVCIWATLRSLRRVSDRSLLAGQLATDTGRLGQGRRRPFLAGAIVLAVLGGALLAATVGGLIGRTGGFFGAGAGGLGACLSLFAFWLRRTGGRPLGGHGWIPVTRLGARNVTYRPGRSVLAIAVVASATFMLISVEAFRRTTRISTADRHTGVGGYALQVEMLIPIVHDPNDAEGRRILGLTSLGAATIEPFRLLPGEDASCLNLYEPKNPRILAPRDSFLAENRFVFRGSLASNDAERANPWLLLQRNESDDAVPVIADANSMTYVLHRKLGDDIVLTRGDRMIRLRLVAALDDSMFQGELLMSQANFLRLFPEHQGYQFALVETPPDQMEKVSAALEGALSDFGADAKSTVERLAEFHKVENTYLSTFQTLGGLGLLLGTLGLGAVLMRNVLERRRELALLQALGYRPVHVLGMVLAENAWLLVAGLVTGTVCALVAIAPVLLERGGRLPVASLLLLLGSVLLVGLTASFGATTAALRSPLLPSLRAE